MFAVGDMITVTVHMIGGRSEDVTAAVVEVNMSRKTPGRVLSYVVDAVDTGYGKLSIPATDARKEH